MPLLRANWVTHEPMNACALSDIMVFGRLYQHTKSSKNANISASNEFLKGTASDHLVKYSIENKIHLCLANLGGLIIPMKSRPH